MARRREFTFYAYEGNQGGADPLQGQMKKNSGTLEVAFPLTDYTGTFSMRQIHYEGSLTADPSSGSTGSVLTDGKAATGTALFIADEHNSRKILFTSGRAFGKTVTVTDTSASGSLTVSSNVFGTLKARSGDSFLIYSTKVDASTASITSAAAGEFQYTWGTTDLNTPGRFVGEFRFSHTSTGNKVFHFPTGAQSVEKIEITVSPAINA